MPIFKRRVLPAVGDLKMFGGTEAELNRELLRGWAIADGSNGTLNLIDKFPKFGTMAEKGTEGGAKTVTPAGNVSVAGRTLSVSQMPAHDHSVNSSNDYTGSGRLDEGGSSSGTYNTNDRGGSESHNHGASFAGNSHTNEPQYTVCVPLQYVGFAV